MAAPPARVLRRGSIVLVVVLAVVAGWAVGRWTAPTPAVPDEESVDVGFLRDMSDHHDQAVQLALLVLGNGEHPLVRGFATDTIASQRHELGLMEARLRDWGAGRGAVGRQAMTWMGHATPVAEMPGMASQAELAELGRARGADADLLFIRLMTAHHEGGIDMAEHAWEHARTDEVRELAERIAKVQRVEVRDLEQVREQVAAAAAGSG